MDATLCSDVTILGGAQPLNRKMYGRAFLYGFSNPCPCGSLESSEQHPWASFSPEIHIEAEREKEAMVV